ncbi:hypothetical protein [Nonomuraea sp. NPDC050643]|uniref:hypothetical protein n=1 Tax=Nonomuraea sp. NPDC050643 TaxID=3155660 RepID=UPI0033E0E08B
MTSAHERDRDPLGRRIRARIGRRGASLAFFALVDLAYASVMAWAPPEVTPGSSAAVLARLMPLAAWAIPWAAVGLLCAAHVCAARDLVAFGAASALCAGWSVIHLAGWAFGVIDRGFVTAVVWGGFGAFIQVIAGWGEPARPDRGA